MKRAASQNKQGEVLRIAFRDFRETGPNLYAFLNFSMETCDSLLSQRKLFQSSVKKIMNFGYPLSHEYVHTLFASFDQKLKSLKVSIQVIQVTPAKTFWSLKILWVTGNTGSTQEETANH